MSKIFKKRNVWYFDDYFNHLESKANEIPSEIQSFVLDPERYLFNKKNTLHDSNLIKFKIGVRNKKDNVTLNFSGAYQDRVFSFVFSKVSRIAVKGNFVNFNNNDLIIHQFLIKSKKYFTYEFVFSDNVKIIIDFTSLKITESVK